jgi:hypothetical protein
MNVTMNQLLIVVILLLAGCSTRSGTEATQPAPIQLASVQPTALEMCKADAGSPHYYRKAVLVADTTAKNDIARDLPGLANLTSERLQAHLDALDRFKVLAAHPTGFASRDTHTAERVRLIGRRYASQFVVKLEILDLTLHSPEGFFVELFEDKRRDVLIKLFIYDAEHGALFYSNQYQDSVSGDVVGYPGYEGRVSTAWFNTVLGMKIDEILKAMSSQINEQLACVPFATEVIAVSGDNIHLNAGYLHGIKPGVTLQVYHRSELRIAEGTQKLEKKGGWIRVNTVLPHQSIATATEDNSFGSLVNTGDLVRAW